jgi:ornithine decarboxylase
MRNTFNYDRPSAVSAGTPTKFRNSQHVLKCLEPNYPLYLFNRTHLAHRASEFQTQFPGTVSYAVKANTRNRVLRTLVDSGINNFDVASLAEIQQLKAINSGVKIHFNNPIKSSASIMSAYRDYGVCSFALDDKRELDKINQACEDPTQLMLSVRFKLDTHQAAYDFGSKFGATPEQAIELLSAIRHTGARAALTFHPGSQCTDAQEYRRYIMAASNIALRAGVALAQLNVGGGFPEYYANTQAENRLHYFSVIKHALNEAFPVNAPPLMCEPGRAMVASCISLLCRVIHVRHNAQTVFINDGIYGGLQEQCLTDLALPLRVWRDARRVVDKFQAFTVFGPTCDPVDRLPRRLDLPTDIREGDYLEFGLVGAYGSATATRFNGFNSQRYVYVREGIV